MGDEYRDNYARILEEHAVGLCVECGKCVTVCPMAEMYPDFGWGISPRGMVQQALRGSALLSGQGIWRCTQCEACSKTCPAGVDCCGLVAALRPLARDEEGATPSGLCSECGAELPPAPVLEYLRKALPQAPLEYLSLCPACRRQRYVRNNS